MAEIIQSSGRKKTGVQKINKASLKVDLTPMVDLGFLLISFFVFTTTLSQPKALSLIMPDDKNIKDSSQAPVSKTLNLVPDANNNVYSYNGDSLNDMKNSEMQVDSMRSVIMLKKLMLIKHYGTDSGMIVLIKPTKNASYNNIIRTLDEMLICNIKTYVLMNASDDEMQKINSF